jgi:predicted phosphodiesterase
MTDNEQRLFLLGDIHGDFRKLYRYIDTKVIENSDVIQLGDMAIGFYLRLIGDPLTTIQDKQLMELNDALAGINCNFMAIRGNHCDGSYWIDPTKNQEFNKKFSNITLIPDYTTKEYFGKKFLLSGGGVSVDRHSRKVGVDYWEDEVVVSPRFPVGNHDIMLSHSCPSYFNHSPFQSHHSPTSDLMKWAHKNDPNLEEDLITERQILDQVVSVSGVKEIYYGHFHNRQKEEHNGVTGRCLDIDELMEYTLS